MFLTLDKTWERKIKEAILSVQIEKRYTKNEILTLYCNHILFGHGTFGVEAASRLYFNKHAKDLKLEEAAMIAGIIQSPARQSPYVNPEARPHAPQLHAAAHGRRGLHHAGAVGRSEGQADCHERPPEHRIRRAVLRRGSAPAPRRDLRREAAL